MTSKRLFFIMFFVINAMRGPVLWGAVGTFVPAPNRVDIVHDANRDLLYISSGGEVLRYSLSSNSFLSPLTLGGQSYGMDLSPDGNLLAVADQSGPVNGANRVHLVDLRTGLDQALDFPVSFLETGTYSVAFGLDGSLLVTSSFGGSGWVPLRRYDPLTGLTEVIAEVRQDSMLTASADGETIALAQSNISSGPVNRYSVAAHRLLGEVDTGWFNYEVGVSRDGGQFAVPTYGGAFIYDGTSNQIGLIGEYVSGHPVGVVYSPVADAVFFAWAGSSEVRAYHTVTLQELGRYDFGSGFQSPGNQAFIQGRLKISRDGSLLFCTVDGGVRYCAVDLTVPSYSPAHRLVIASNPPNYGTPTPLPFGTNWLEGPFSPMVNVSMESTFETNSTRYFCTGWTGSGDAPTSGTETTASFTLNQFSTLTWNWTVSDYRLLVTVQGSGQVDVTDSWFAKGSVVTVTARADLGYRFDGWVGSVAPAQVHDSRLALTMDSPKNLVATFVPDVLLLTIQGNPPGVGQAKPQPYGVSSISRTAIVTNRVNTLATNGGALYRSTGWNGSGDVPATGTGGEVVFTLTQDSTLTWLWQLTDFRLTIATNGNGGINPGSDWYPPGALVSLMAVPAAHYRFDHWSGDLSAGVTNQNPLAVTMDQPRSVVAVFVPDVVTLVIEGNPVRAGSPLTEGYGTNFVLRGSMVANRVTEVATTATTRFACLGWSGTGDVPVTGIGTQAVFSITQDSRLVWNWVATDYWLAAGVSGSGSINSTSGWVRVNSSVSVVATPGPHYRFDHWEDDGGAEGRNQNPLILTMDRAHSITAVFVMDTLQLVIRADTAAVGNPAPYSYGTNFVLRGTTLTNSIEAFIQRDGTTYTNVGWLGLGSVPVSGTCTQAVFTLTENSTLAWQWLATDYFLTVVTNGQGIVSLQSAWFAAGSSLELRATPAAHYRFDHWTGDIPEGAAQTNPLKLTLNQPRKITAIFVPDTLVFQVDSSPSGFGAPYPDSFGPHPILRGTMLTNHPGSMADVNGTRFICTGWSGTGDIPVEGKGTEVVFVLTQDSSISWRWEPSAHHLKVTTAGIGTTSLTNDFFSIGSIVTNTAIPGPGQKFIRWYGNVPPGSESQNPLALAMDQPFDLVAYFAPDGSAPAALTGDWPMYGKGPEHTGYFPGTVGKNQFIESWVKDIGSGLQQVAVGDGNIFVVTSLYFGAGQLRVLREFSGDQRWSYTFPGAFSLNPPAYDAGSVFVQRVDNGGDTQLWSFDATSGKTNWVADHGAQWEHYLAPTVSNGKVYVDGGTYGGMYGFDEKTGAQLFFQSREQYDGWTPTFSADKVYSWVGGQFAESDPLTGQTLRSINLGWNWSGWTMGRAVAIHGGLASFVGNSQLYVVDLFTFTTSWMLENSFTGTPALANGMLFAISNNAVQVHVARTGDYLGSYVANELLRGQPIVTDDALIVSSDSATYIFDLGTFTVRQTLPVGGQATVANGVLYLVDAAGTLHAYSAGATRQLTITSDIDLSGYPEPAYYGTNAVPDGLAILARVNSPLSLPNGLFLVATGWTGTGSVPANGTNSQVSAVISQDSTLRWLWQTQSLLNVSATAHGSVTPSLGGYAVGSLVHVTAAADPYYHFTGWRGTLTNTDNPLDLTLIISETLVAGFAPDLVTNQVPAYWLAQNQIEPNDLEALTDTDNDGIPNWQEYFSGTDPRDPASLLRVVSVQRMQQNRMLLQWSSVAGRKYRIWSSANPDFTQRSLIAEEIGATPPLNSIFTGTYDTQMFFLIEVEIP
jgi:hypothetical protein